MNAEQRIQMLEKMVTQLTAELGQVRRRLANLPAEWSRGAGGGGTLPTGTGRGKVLMLIDELTPGTVGWDYPIFPETV